LFEKTFQLSLIGFIIILQAAILVCFMFSKFERHITTKTKASQLKGTTTRRRILFMKREAKINHK
jgi:hypothetical protein